MFGSYFASWLLLGLRLELGLGRFLFNAEIG